MEQEMYIKKKDIAKYLGYNPMTLERWADAGCPCFISPGGEKTFKISEVVEWASEQNKKKKDKI